MQSDMKMTVRDHSLRHPYRTLCLMFVILWPVDGWRKGCQLSENWSGAAASPNRTSPAQSVISCTPCNYNGKYEVHILQVYEWTKLPLEVNVTAVRDTVLYLILINVRPTHWMLRIPRRVTIGEVRVLSYNDPQKNSNFYNQILLENGEHLNAFVARQHYYMFPRPGTTLGEDLTEMVEYVNKEFGFITSYTGIEETSGWNLTVGTCDLKDGNDTRWCDLSSKENATGSPIDFSSSTHYSCSPCNYDGLHETHVLNMYGPSQDWSSDVIVEVYTKRKKTKISLVLINRDAVNWIIRLGTYWWIDVIEIHLLTANTSGSSVMLETAKDYNPYIIERNMFISGWDAVSQFEGYCRRHFGFLSSYNGIKRARKWTLNVGMCLPLEVEPSEEKSPNFRTGLNFPNYFIPVIVIPAVGLIFLFYVPMIIENRLNKSKIRRNPPPVVTLNALRRQMGIGLNPSLLIAYETEPTAPAEAEVHHLPPGYRAPKPSAPVSLLPTHIGDNTYRNLDLEPLTNIADTPSSPEEILSCS